MTTLSKAAQDGIRYMMTNSPQTREDMETIWAKPLARKFNCATEDVMSFAATIGFAGRREDPEVVALRRVHQERSMSRNAAYREWSHEED